MGKRRADDDDSDPEWVWSTAGFALGHIGQLSEKEPVGTPYEKKRGPLGFDITPGQTKKKRRRKRG